MQKKKLFYFELKPGMIVAQDVYSGQQQLIVPENTVLNDAIIGTLSSHSIFELLVVDPPKNSDTVLISSSYSEKIKSSQEFQVFKENYLESVLEAKDLLNDVVNKNTVIDTSAVISSSVNLLSNASTGFHIFDMLHSMRDYDDSTHIHSVNVGLISAIIGKWLNYSDEDIQALILCGMLHDIGKLTIPLEILAKPGKLTDEEYNEVKKHPLNGYSMLKDQPIDERAKEACLFHHERCDGSGYPFGVLGNRIPLFAKVVAIADVYDAMTANRVYRNGICPFDVIKLFENEGLHNFDPRIVITFLENIVQTYIHNSVQLSNGDVGEIIMINRFDLARPVVKCGEKFVDLSKETDLKITAIL